MKRLWITLAVALSLLSNTTLAKGKNDDWVRVAVPPTLTVNKPVGQSQTLHPSCSGGPVCTMDPASGMPDCRLGNTDFSFFYHRGENQNLLVYLQKGGACWDSTTCLSSTLTARPLYKREIPPDETPASAGGIMDVSRADNPFREWNVVYIPACTGDLHWGSNDETYPDYTGLLGGQVTIHHRGHDNFQAVLAWLQDHKQLMRMIPRGPKASKIAVAGASAGGYGALPSFAAIRTLWPKTDDFLIVDGANGILTDDFMTAVISNANSPWQHFAAFPSNPAFQNWLTTPQATLLEARYIDLLQQEYGPSQGYGSTRIGQYTTAFDASQTTFFQITSNLTNPAAWDLAALLQSGDPVSQMQAIGAFCQWHAGMLATTGSNAQTTPDYRFYIGAGTAHTALVTYDFDGAPFTPIDAFYKENSAGKSLKTWVGNMLSRPNRWANAACTGAACAGTDPNFTLPFPIALCPAN